MVKSSKPKTQRKLKPTPRQRAKAYVHYHKDGTVWAKGKRIGETPTGYWEWFRKDGTKSRSGHFDHGKQTGEWTTYDQMGRVYKVTVKRPRPS